MKNLLTTTALVLVSSAAFANDLSLTFNTGSVNGVPTTAVQTVLDQEGFATEEDINDVHNLANSARITANSNAGDIEHNYDLIEANTAAINALEDNQVITSDNAWVASGSTYDNIGLATNHGDYTNQAFLDIYEDDAQSYVQLDANGENSNAGIYAGAYEDGSSEVNIYGDSVAINGDQVATESDITTLDEAKLDKGASLVIDREFDSVWDAWDNPAVDINILEKDTNSAGVVTEKNFSYTEINRGFTTSTRQDKGDNYESSRINLDAHGVNIRNRDSQRGDSQIDLQDGDLLIEADNRIELISNSVTVNGNEVATVNDVAAIETAITEGLTTFADNANTVLEDFNTRIETLEANGTGSNDLPIVINGVDGIDGVDGMDGAKGDKGDKGDRGERGEQGLQGIQGIQGEKGDRGEAGRDGVDGVTTVVKETVITVDGEASAAVKEAAEIVSTSVEKVNSSIDAINEKIEDINTLVHVDDQGRTHLGPNSFITDEVTKEDGTTVEVITAEDADGNTIAIEYKGSELATEADVANVQSQINDVDEALSAEVDAKVEAVNQDIQGNANSIESLRQTQITATRTIGDALETQSARIDSIEEGLSSLSATVSAGIAGNAAQVSGLSALGGEAGLYAGLGNFNGVTAIALGGQFSLSDGITANFGASFDSTGKNPVVSGGVGFKF